MSQIEKFVMPTARPLPVILLVDVSGSMSTDGKIDAMNAAAADMIHAFAEEDDTRAEIHVGVIAFGGDKAYVHARLTPASSFEWRALPASGRTPMGHAFELARTLMEDREQLPSRAYRPTLVLISDGVPTDDWQPALRGLLESPRASKATRLALGIGDDADEGTLRAFLGDSDARVFKAHEARQIKQFFRWVTMSVTTRSRSTSPNAPASISPEDIDDVDF